MQNNIRNKKATFTESTFSLKQAEYTVNKQHPVLVNTLNIFTPNIKEWAVPTSEKDWS